MKKRQVHIRLFTVSLTDRFVFMAVAVSIVKTRCLCNIGVYLRLASILAIRAPIPWRVISAGTNVPRISRNALAGGERC